MKIVKVPDQWFRPNASYKRSLVIRGHVAGYLSGRNLAGGAKFWSSKYATARGEVNKKLAPLGVGAGPYYMLKKEGQLSARYKMVWLDQRTGEPVQLVFHKFSKDELIALEAKRKIMGG